MLVALLHLLTVAYAVGQGGNVVYQGQVSELGVVAVEGDTYFWELYTDENLTQDFAVVPGNCPAGEAYFVDGIDTGPIVNVMWLTPGIYFFKVTATGPDGCSNNIKIGKMTVLEGYSTAIFLETTPICEGDSLFLTVEISGGVGPWSITYTDGTTEWTINDIQDTIYTFNHVPAPTITTDFWITSVTNGYGLTTDEDSDPVTQIVYPTPNTSPIYRYEP